jgi:CIC family chloride channel protein
MISLRYRHPGGPQVRGESIYTLKLLRRGLDIRSGKEMNLLRSLKVKEAMRSEVISVPQDMPLREFHNFVVRSKAASFPVVNDNGGLVGIVGHADYVDHFQDHDLWDVVVVLDLATRQVMFATPGESLDSALDKLAKKDFATLPVVAAEDDMRLLGVVSHRDITSYYNRRLRKLGM